LEAEEEIGRAKRLPGSKGAQRANRQPIRGGGRTRERFLSGGAMGFRQKSIGTKIGGKEQVHESTGISKNQNYSRPGGGVNVGSLWGPLNMMNELQGLGV